jgi:hypothetical protein
VRLKTFYGDWEALANAQFMFNGCRNLTKFIGATNNTAIINFGLNSLNNAQSMFANCFNLTNFHVINMVSINNGLNMFLGCNNMVEFNINNS